MGPAEGAGGMRPVERQLAPVAMSQSEPERKFDLALRRPGNDLWTKSISTTE